MNNTAELLKTAVNNFLCNLHITITLIEINHAANLVASPQTCYARPHNCFVKGLMC